MDIKEIYAAADLDNLASNKILTKVGLKWVEIFDLEGVPHNWYRISQSEWLER